MHRTFNVLNGAFWSRHATKSGIFQVFDHISHANSVANGQFA